MNVTNLWDFFPGFYSFILMEPANALIRILLILIGIFLVYMGYKDKLDPLLMLPMGFMMAVVNGGILITGGGELGTLFVDPMVSEPGKLLDALQINFLQPFYNFTFANGLIACLVFMGIGGITDLDFFIARPFLSLFLALAAELGTILTFPLAVALCGWCDHHSDHLWHLHNICSIVLMSAVSLTLIPGLLYLLSLPKF